MLADETAYAEHAGGGFVYSGANGGSCIETASGAGVILVRDTTDRDGFTLSVPTETWARFTATIKLARRADERASSRYPYLFCSLGEEVHRWPG
jgi:hypothetical protein